MRVRWGSLYLAWLDSTVGPDFKDLFADADVPPERNVILNKLLSRCYRPRLFTYIWSTVRGSFSHHGFQQATLQSFFAYKAYNNISSSHFKE